MAQECHRAGCTRDGSNDCGTGEVRVGYKQKITVNLFLCDECKKEAGL